MPRPLRVQEPGLTYHVTCRGNRKSRIFDDDADRRRLLKCLGEVVFRCGWRCAEYCLMTTHFHLLITTPRANIAAGMQRLNGIYAQSFNRRYGFSGHLFEGRYGSKLMESEPHVHETIRYIALNPVRAGICALPEQWPWSSYAATIGLVPPPAFLTVSGVLEEFSADRERAQRLLRDFVRAGIERLREAA